MARSPSHSGGRIGEFLYVGLCLLLLGFSIHFWQDNIYGDEESDSFSRQIGKSLRLNQGKNGIKAGGSEEQKPLLIVGTHHKTGTALMALVLREAYAVHQSLTGQSNGVMMGYFGNAEKPNAPFSFYFCDNLYADTWNKTDINTTDHLPKLVDHHQFFSGPFYFAHLVRDPLELVISAYLYHYGGPPEWQEPWLYEQHPIENYKTIVEGSSCDYSNKSSMSWYDVLHCLTETEGVLAEATFQTYFGALPSMVAAVKDIHNKPGVKVLKLDLAEFQSDFDGSVRDMFNFFDMPEAEVDKIVRGCSQYDLKRQSWSERQNNQHVTTGKFDKSKLRATMATFKDQAFLEARAILGYPKASSSSKPLSSLPSPSSPAGRRRKMKAAMMEKEKEKEKKKR